MGGAAQGLLEIAQHPGNARVIAETMEILHQQQGGTAAVQIPQPLQHRHRLAGTKALPIENALEAVNEIPAAKLVIEA